MQFNIHFIGAGNLGQTFAKLITIHQAGNIAAIVNRSLTSARKAQQFIGAGQALATLDELPAADIIFITTPDDEIATIVKQLMTSNKIKPNTLVAHCSGCLSSEILQPLKAHQAQIASVHPMKSFANPTLSVEQFKGTYCALEGDEIAVDKLNQLFDSLGAICYPINTKQKALYHVAGVFASNYLVTLFHQAQQFLRQAGVENETAISVILGLMASTLTNLSASRSATNALTGPIKRGDIATVAKHIEAIDNPKLYKVLGEMTVPLAPLSPEVKNHLLQLLEETGSMGAFKLT